MLKVVYVFRIKDVKVGDRKIFVVASQYIANIIVGVFKMMGIEEGVNYDMTCVNVVDGSEWGKL